jgi:hypothetical protein
MFNNCRKWRQEIEIDKVYKTFPADFTEQREVTK